MIASTWHDAKHMTRRVMSRCGDCAYYPPSVPERAMCAMGKDASATRGICNEGRIRKGEGR